MTQGRWADAESRLAEALTLAPMQAGTWNNLGVVSQELRRTEAETCFRNAVAIGPLAWPTHTITSAACCPGRDSRMRRSPALRRRSRPIRDLAALGWGRAWRNCRSCIEVGGEKITERRQRYTAALTRLVAGDARLLADAIGTSQPFFLPYQGQDDRALQALYGQFACDALAAAEPPAPLPVRPEPGQRIRLGIVSGFFCDHTLWKLFLEGWLTEIDRGRFEVIGFHTGQVSDDQTARAAKLCDRFVCRLTSRAAWRAAVVDTVPHVLLYPEVGMDPIAGRLAAMRLAPVQCVAWGQPETTGMPTIDYFLSSDLMEPADGDAYYTERLVRLPNLGLNYTPDPDSSPPSVMTGRASTRVRAGPVTHDFAPSVFWSGQALYKYLPQYDAIFPRIAAELGACQFVFIGFAKSQAVTDAFRDRLWAAFAGAGLDAGRHVVILPPMSQRDYIDAVGRADVILDTPGWSGGKSTLDCLVHNPAIVTLPGRFMRGRHTAAILRRIGCEATIAQSVDDYVAIAVRLARDHVWRAEVRQSVARGKESAFNDQAYIRALEHFLAEAAFRTASGAVDRPHPRTSIHTGWT